MRSQPTNNMTNRPVEERQSTYLRNIKNLTENSKENREAMIPISDFIIDLLDEVYTLELPLLRTQKNIVLMNVLEYHKKILLTRW